MMNNTYKRGFTLIELLVVIAIIGILASVVLASLNTARTKGADANIESNLTNMRARAELYYDANNQSYIDMCADQAIVDALASADNANLTGTTLCVDANSVPDAWALHAQLLTDPLEYFCVDSTGASVITDGTTISNSSGSEDATCS